MTSKRFPSWISIASVALLVASAILTFFLTSHARHDLQALDGEWKLSGPDTQDEIVSIPMERNSWNHTEGPFLLDKFVEIEPGEKDLTILIQEPRYHVQVVWDGVSLGGTRSVETESRGQPPGEPILIQIPDALTDAGTHRLRLELSGYSGRTGIDSQILFGSFREGQRAMEHHRLIALILPLVNVGIALCALLLSVVWGNRRDLFWLGVVCFCLVGFGLVESYEWWFLSDDQDLRIKASIGIRSLLVASAIRLYAWFFTRKVGRLDQLLSFSNVIFAVVVLMWWGRNSTLFALENLGGIGAILVFIRAVYLPLRALKNRSVESYFMILGLGMAGLAMVFDLLYLWMGLQLRPLVPVFALGMSVLSLVALMSRLSDESSRYRQLINVAKDALLVVDREGRIWEANPASSRLLGTWNLGDSLLTRLPARDRERCLAHIQGEGRDRRIELGFPTSAGESTMESVAVDLPNGRIVMLLRDISARRTMESGMLHAARMETVGAIAGGIAHDFNNTMTALLGQVGVMQMQTEIKRRGPLQQMESIILHASRMMQRLMAVARGSVETHEPVDMVEMIRESAELVELVLSRRIELKLNLADEPMMVMGSVADLEQILLNMVVNSRDALGQEGGKIWLSMGPCEDDPSRIELVFEDSGPGVPLELREKIWKPFFSTKTQARGTGLGLSVVARVVRDHAGIITLEPARQGGGCCFRVVLPRMDAEYSPRSDLPIDADVLVVEDDEDIRSMIRRSLQSIGCRVMDFPDAEQAHLYAQGGPVDLLVTDAVLPGATGLELASQLQKQRLSLRVMVISAYLPENASQIDPSWYCISKPFSRSRLEHAVRRALKDRTQGSSQTK